MAMKFAALLLLLASSIASSTMAQSASPTATPPSSAAIPTAIDACSAPATPPAKYVPTPEQCLRLKVLQQDAIISQQQMQTLQAQLQQVQTAFQAKLKALTDEAAAVKKANHWGDRVAFNPNDDTFADAPAPAPATAKDAKGDKK